MMKKSTFKVCLTPRAIETLDAIGDSLTREAVIAGIENLKQRPDTQGKTLAGELTGYRGLKVSGTGLRVIYQVERGLVTVYIVAGRERRRVMMKMDSPPLNVHSLTRRMIQTRLLDTDDLDE